MITQERLKELLHYDPETGVFTWKFRDKAYFHKGLRSESWNSKWANTIAGSIFTCHGITYKHTSIFKKSYRMHRLAWLYVYGEWPDQIDHINGNGIDNRILNLRSVTNRENHRNVKLRTDNKSGVNGVNKCKQTKKWKVRINIYGKEKWIGRFDSFEEAKKARKAAEVEYGFHANHGMVRK